MDLKDFLGLEGTSANYEDDNFLPPVNLGEIPGDDLLEFKRSLKEVERAQEELQYALSNYAMIKTKREFWWARIRRNMNAQNFDRISVVDNNLFGYTLKEGEKK